MSVDQIVDALAAQGALARVVSDGRQHLVGSGAIDTIFLRIAGKHRDRLRERIAEDPDRLAAPISDLIRDLANKALAAQAMCTAHNARVADIVACLAGNLRPAIGGNVTDVYRRLEARRAQQPLRR